MSGLILPRKIVSGKPFSLVDSIIFSSWNQGIGNGLIFVAFQGY